MADIDDEIAELKTRLAKLEAQKAAQSTAPSSTATPVVDEPTKDKDGFTNRLTTLMGGGAALFVVLALLASLLPKTPTPKSDQPVPVDLPPGPIQPLTPREPAAPHYAWTYSEDVDSMSDRKTRMACVDSTDTVNLDWPYKATTAELCIRNSPKFGFDVFYRLNGDGQILCDSYDGCSIKIRYGDAPAGRNGALTSEDHSSNIVFLTGARNVAARLAKAKSTRMELTYYQAGSQTVTFPTEGLDLTKVGLGGGKKKG
ncbi:hypothetical protein [Caulobacter sp. RL271]|uniref:Uncharacterized protein n=1 Tax=Caulobacter segnis TaxID=88688 RepID=A0ABY4ZPX9_9CAUL|nr:hypothetical protein [Caulobacter segnis]USQ94026.1 hypothetical protein MZV50_15560 [Caulobacter segnis]